MKEVLNVVWSGPRNVVCSNVPSSVLYIRPSEMNHWFVSLYLSYDLFSPTLCSELVDWVKRVIRVVQHSFLINIVCSEIEVLPLCVPS